MSRVLSLFPEEENQALRESPLGATSLFPDPDPLERVAASKAGSPDTAARVLRQQVKTGLPAPVIERNLEEIEQRSAAADFDAAAFRRTNPFTAAWLAENPEHWKLAQDDLENLSAIERALGFARALPGAAGAGVTRFNQSFWGKTLEAAEILESAWAESMGASAPNPFSSIKETARRYGREQRAATIRLETPQEGLGWERHLLSGGTSVLAGAPLFLAGRPDVAVVGMGAVTSGESYFEAREQGLGPLQSSFYANTQGLIEGVTELVPASRFIQNLAARAGAVRTIVDLLATEVPGEQIATALQDLNAWAALPENQDRPIGDYLRARPSAALGTLIATGAAAGLQGAGLRALDRAVHGRDPVERFFDDFGEAVRDSKTYQRLPPKLAELVERSAEGVETVYVAPDAWRSYWQSKHVDPRAKAADVVSDLAQYDDAVATGAKIAIPMARYAEHIAGTEHNAFFERELSVAPDQMSAREFDDFVPDISSEIAAIVETQPESTAQAAARIEQDVIGQMLGQGIPRETIEEQARFLARGFRAIAERAEVDLAELWGRFGPTIVRPLPEILRTYPSIDAIDVLVDRLRSGAVFGEGELFGPSLVAFLKQQGGVIDEGGELKALDVDRARKPFERKLVQEKGMSLDRAREAAAEAGYIAEDSTVADFLDAIEREVRGSPVYSTKQAGDPQKVELARTLDELADYLRGLGVELHSTTNAEIKAMLEAGRALPEAEVAFAQAQGRGRLAIDPKTGKPRLELLKDANLSTFFHETGHLFLEIYKATADGLRARERSTLSEKQRAFLDDFDRVLLPWLGAQPGAALTEAQHEQFARGIEAYLAEGKAPSPELRRPFARFRQWLIDAYRLWRHKEGATPATIARELDVQLTDEVRGFMDRLLASETEIAAAEAEARIQAKIDSDARAARVGMSPEEYRPYRETVERAARAARERLDAELAREARREHERWWLEKREEVRAQVVAEVNRTKSYAALSLLQYGRLPDGSVPPEGRFVGKLDKKAIVDRFGKEFLKRLPRPYVYTSKGGVSPDLAADLLGYSSGEALLRDLVAAGERPQGKFIEAETDSRMREIYGDLLLDGTAAEKAREAVLGDERSRVVHAEMKAFQKKAREVRPFVRAREQVRARGRRRMLGALPSVESVRAWARTRIESTRVGDLRPDVHFRAAQQASRLAFEAAAKDQWDAALHHATQELMSIELYRAARGARDRVEEAIADFASMFVADSKLERLRNMDYVNAARAIWASAAAMPLPAANAATYLERVKAYDPDMYETLIEKIDSVVRPGHTYKNLTYSEFLGMRDVVQGLWDMSRRVEQVRIEGQMLDRERIVNELHVAIAKVAGETSGLVGYRQAATRWEKAQFSLMGMRAALRRVESFTEAMDRGEGEGPFHKYIWNPVSAAAARYRIVRNDLVARYLEIVKRVERTMVPGKIEAPELGYTFASKAELLHAVLHSGNPSNLQKLLRGRGWGDWRADGTLDTSRWDALRARLEAQGVLTREDYQYAQDVWDLFESLKPEAQQVHHDLYGSYFSELSFETVRTSFGDFRGGYVPAIVDPFLAPDAHARSEKEALREGDQSFMFPATGRGFTKAREERYAKPLALDLRLIPQHLDKVLRFIHLQPAVKDVARIVFDRNFQATLGHVDPAAVGELLVPWLQRTATQRVSSPHTGWGGRGLNWFFKLLRNRGALNLMTLNIPNALQQWTGLSLAAVKVKPRYLRSALWAYMKDPKGVSSSIAAKSEFMRTRTGPQAVEMLNTIDEILLNPSRLATFRQWANAHGYFLQQMTQSVVDHVTWAGAYDAAVEGGATEAEAVRRADGAVRQTQGSFAPEDVSNIESRTPFIRLFTMYYGYFNMQANLLGTEFANAMHAGGLMRGAGRALYVFTLGFLLPAVLGEAILTAVRGEDWRDDDEWWLDDLMWFFFGAQYRTAAAMLPGGAVARSAVSVYERLAGGPADAYEERITLSPAIRTIEETVRAPASVYKAIAGEGSAKRAVRDGLSAVGVVTGYSAVTGAMSRPAGYAAEVLTGEAEPESAFDVARGLASGQSRR